MVNIYEKEEVQTKNLNVDHLGSPRKTYKEDSWDESKMAHDMSGMQRSGDVDYPEFYTLNSGGMINSFLENMEKISFKTGELNPTEPSEDVSGKVLMPNSGSGNPAWWGMDVMVMRAELPWSLPDSWIIGGWKRKSPGSVCLHAVLPMRKSAVRPTGMSAVRPTGMSAVQPTGMSAVHDKENINPTK